MKTSSNITIDRIVSSRLRVPCLALGALGALAVNAGAAVIPPVTEDFDQVGWVGLTGNYVWVDGNEATFRQRHQMPDGASGGLSSFYWENFLSRDLTMVIEGRALFDQNDHFLNVRFVNEDRGFISIGFKESRNWYDGSGGYLSSTDLFIPPLRDELYIDRGEFWIEGGINFDDLPSINLRYTHRYRRGDKDSTVWGTAPDALTGVGNRKVVPSFREIDETRHIFEGRGTHAFGNTDVGLGLRYEVSTHDNSLEFRNNPGLVNESTTVHREELDADIFSTHAWAKTQLSEKIQLSTAYMFTRIDTDIGGYRAADGTPSVENVVGGAKVKQHVVNLNLLTRPWEHLLVIPSLRFEKLEQEAVSRWNVANVIDSEYDLTNFSQRLELRYTGVPRWHFFARGDWMQGDGDRVDILEPANVANRSRETETERRRQEYTVGAQWSPMRALSATAQYAHKIRKNDFDHIVPGRPGQHPAFLQEQDFTTDAFSVRATIRPAAGVTLVSRYDLELTEIETRGSTTDNGDQVPLPTSVTSGDRERHAFSQSASWMPLPRLYLLGSVNYTYDRLKTPANSAAGDPSSVVHEQKNDYWVASVGTSYVYSDRTDLNLNYFYYLADNYRDNSVDSVPYGVGEREHGITATMVYRIDNNLIWSVGYGFFTYREDTWGGNRDYDAHLAHTGLTVHF